MKTSGTKKTAGKRQPTRARKARTAYELLERVCEAIAQGIAAGSSVAAWDLGRLIGSRLVEKA